MRHLIRWLVWALALILLAFALVQTWYAAHIWWWREHPPRETAFMATRLAELRERRPDARLAYVWSPTDPIPGQLNRAMIPPEDPRSADHEGSAREGIEPPPAGTNPK